MQLRYYYCRQCGKIIAMIKDSGAPTVCCGEAMRELIPGTGDGSGEKHVPVIEMRKNFVTVKVGAEEHPMTEEHYIEWISIFTNQGIQHKNLSPGLPPSAIFAISYGEKIMAAYAYCNIHKLWSITA